MTKFRKKHAGAKKDDYKNHNERKKIVGCCVRIYFVCLNCKVKFVLPRLKKGMRLPASFRRAMVNE